MSRQAAEEIIAAVEEAFRQGYAWKARSNPGKSAIVAAAKALGLSSNQMNYRVRSANEFYGLTPDTSLIPSRTGIKPIPPAAANPDIDEPQNPSEVIEASVRAKGGATMDELTQATGLGFGEIMDLLESLKGQGINVHRLGDFWTVEKTLAPREVGTVKYEYVSRDDNTFVFGVTTDNHIGSKYARNDVLRDLYDRFERQGVDRVFNAGNWIDGEARFNKHDLEIHGLDAQIRALVREFPQREGLTTYAIAGDDHEGWYAQREGLDIGKYAENAFTDAGRSDWIYCGYMEADFRLTNKNSGESSILRVVHPGGGSSYAISYSMQKLVESYEGGDKPAVVVGGHYHKMNVMNYRNVWIIQAGTTEDQTTFMRKKKLEAHVGGLIVTLEQDPRTGAITVCNDIFRYFNQGYYETEGRWSLSGDIDLPPRSLGGV